MPKPGFLTPSSFDKLMSGFKTPEIFNKTAMSVVDRLAVELAGFREDEDDIEESPGGARGWGIENEWLALETYSERLVRCVQPAEFTVSRDLPYVGGTIDGLIGDDGGVEIKCPFNPTNHINREHQYSIYEYQLHGYMWIFNLQWIDFISFDPRFPENLRLLVETVPRNEPAIDTVKARCRAAYELARRKADGLTFH